MRIPRRDVPASRAIHRVCCANGGPERWHECALEVEHTGPHRCTCGLEFHQ